ncbi:uncharacterized protein TNCV_4823001 [Trichonephila clavipes]|nr:uncharacterized protein TNCV_4823001 [Trichonephila clavipes]
MVSDGTEFVLGDIERLFDETRRKTQAKHEKWEYYNRRRRDVQIMVNEWVLITTHPLSSATKKVVAEFKPKFEGKTDKCGPLIRLPPSSWSETRRKIKRSKNENIGYKRSRESGSGGPERKIQKGSEHRVPKRALSSNYTNRVLLKYRKRGRTEETVMPSNSGYSLRPRNGTREESRPTMEMKENQFEPRKAEESTTAPTSKSKQGQATRIPEEVVNNKMARKGKEERIPTDRSTWRS